MQTINDNTSHITAQYYITKANNATTSQQAEANSNIPYKYSATTRAKCNQLYIAI